MQDPGKALSQDFSTDTELHRELGLKEALSIIVGRIIGSGIFRTPAPIMALVGCVSLFYGVWILGGIATILGAILYAELVAMLPRSGGPYAYLKVAYPPLWSFLRGWAMFFVSETGAIAAVAIVFSEYTLALLELTMGFQSDRTVELTLALGLIWILTWLNLYGVRLAGKMQDYLSLLKILALGLVIVAGFSRSGRLENLTGDFWPDKDFWASLTATFAALRYSFFAYSGWEGSTYVAEEVKNPRRNLPLALFAGISGILLLYLAANTAYLYQLGAQGLASSRQVAVDALQLALGSTGGILISLAIVFNTSGNVSAQIMVKSRTWYAMGRDGLFPRWLGELNHHGVPARALLIQGFWASVLLLAAGLAENIYNRIIDFFSFTSTIFNISTFAAVWILRRKYPDALRPYRAWGYPYTLWIVLLIQGAFLFFTLWTAFWPSMMGAALTLTGLIYYYWRKRKGEMITGAAPP